MASHVASDVASDTGGLPLRADLADGREHLRSAAAHAPVDTAGAGAGEAVGPDGVASGPKHVTTWPGPAASRFMSRGRLPSLRAFHFVCHGGRDLQLKQCSAQGVLFGEPCRI